MANIIIYTILQIKEIKTYTQKKFVCLKVAHIQKLKIK